MSDCTSNSEDDLWRCEKVRRKQRENNHRIMVDKSNCERQQRQLETRARCTHCNIAKAEETGGSAKVGGPSGPTGTENARDDCRAQRRKINNRFYWKNRNLLMSHSFIRVYSCCRNQCAGAFSTRATQNAQNAQSGRILAPLNYSCILQCFRVLLKLEIIKSTGDCVSL